MSKAAKLLSLSRGWILVPRINRFYETRVNRVLDGKEDSNKSKRVRLRKQLTLLDQALKELEGRADRHHSNKWHPSSISGCITAALFNRLYAPQTKLHGTVDESRYQRNFENGDDFHIRMQVLLARMKILVSAEMPVEIEELDLIGHCDGVLRLGGDPYILELKSAKDHYFTGYVRQPGGDHVIQAHCYMKAAKIPRAIILYENKNDQTLCEHVIKFSKTMWKQIERRLARLEKFRAKKKVPPRPEGNDNPDRFPCSFCSFRKVCWDPAEQKKFLKGLK